MPKLTKAEKREKARRASGEPSAAARSVAMLGTSISAAERRTRRALAEMGADPDAGAAFIDDVIKGRLPAPASFWKMLPGANPRNAGQALTDAEWLTFCSAYSAVFGEDYDGER